MAGWMVVEFKRITFQYSYSRNWSCFVSILKWIFKFKALPDSFRIQYPNIAHFNLQCNQMQLSFRSWESGTATVNEIAADFTKVLLSGSKHT